MPDPVVIDTDILIDNHSPPHPREDFFREDNVVPPQDSEDLADRLEAAGVETELLLIPGADHFVAFPGGAGHAQATSAVDSFLARLAGQDTK